MNLSIDHKKVVQSQISLTILFAEEEVICPKNTYSTGGTKRCTDCKAASSEYADAEGSTSCKICEGKVENGDCQGKSSFSDTDISILII
jgi:hypothetical protein